MQIEAPQNFPKGEHLAALVFKSRQVHHEGDERSRTHPGHGYPAYTETIKSVEYIVFSDQAAMEAWVLQAETAKRDKPVYQLLQAKPLQATLHSTVHIDG